MIWNWQQNNWPDFCWTNKELEEKEAAFLKNSGILIGATTYFNNEDKSLLIVDILTDEAIDTSEIEGEYLNRDSVQSSVRKNFGLQEKNNTRIYPAEYGIANMMTNLYQNYNKPLTHTDLYNWHKMLCNGRQDLKDIGRYRTHDDPMQIISGPLHKQKIHFEAPPSDDVKEAMNQFVKWFNLTSPRSKNHLPALTRAAIAHLYFVSIHPFEDGNGRIGRAIAEKSLSQSLGQPTLIALSRAIKCNRKAYYNALEMNNKSMDINNWIIYFAETVLDAQNYTQNMITFLIEKTKLFDKFRDDLNNRQEKVIGRMFSEGPEGFEGGLSADNYITISGTSRATATRDLQGLVDKGVFSKTGELKGTRYHLNIKKKEQILLD